MADPIDLDELDRASRDARAYNRVGPFTLGGVPEGQVALTPDQADAISAELRELRSSAETLGLALVQQTHGHKVQYERAQKAERELREARDLLREIYESVPATHDERDPMVQRHARALNAIRAHLAKHQPKEADRE